MQPKQTARAWMVLAAIGGAVTTAAAIEFTEVGQQAGIRYSFERDLFAPLGGGGAWIDYDNDGWVDLYLTQTHGPNRLFRNQTDGTFEEVLEAAGAADASGWAHGVTAADYDNDGDADLFVTNDGQDRLFRNVLIESGSPGFVDATTEAHMDHAGALNSASAAWGDYDRDGLLDLYVSTHVAEWRPGPKHNLSSPNYLWHNNGDGTFTNVAKELGLDNGAVNTRDGLFTEPGATLATTWSDFDNDGDVDLIVINDFGDTIHPNQLFRNDGPDGDGGWLFTDISMETAFDARIFGMGIAVGDIDRDGDLDYYASHGADNILMLNRLDEGLELFDEIAADAGVTANDPATYGPMMGPISWGVDFADFDLDGWLDLMVVNGWIEHAAGMSEPLQPTVYVYRNDRDLTFSDVSQNAGLDVMDLSGKASALADYDRDGDLDFFVGTIFRWNDITEQQEPGWPLLYRNDTQRAPDTHWFEVKVIGTISNRDAIGTRVTLTAGGVTQMREVGNGTSFLSSGELVQHFGLASATRIDEITMVFPSGIEFTQRNIPVDGQRVVTEPTVVVDSGLNADVFEYGDTLISNASITNLLDEEQTGDIWLDRIHPDGTVVTMRVQAGVTLAPGASRQLNLAIPIDAPLPAGDSSLVVRVGSYPNGIIHQSFDDFTIVVGQ